MASAAQDNSSVSESDVEHEDFDNLYDKIVNEQNEQLTRRRDQKQVLETQELRMMVQT